jgi:hypothetical protein
MDTTRNPMIKAPIQSLSKKGERVGVIVVHGIGDQKRGDHLEQVVRPLVEGFGDDDVGRAGRRVTVHTPLVGDTPASVQIDVGWRDRAGRAHLTEITVHEVHWADINEPNSIGKGLRFWLWGLSAWLSPGKFDVGENNVFTRTMATPRFKGRDPTKQLMLGDRISLFVVGWLFLLAAPPILVADFLAKKVFGTTLPASLQTIVSYVSAVKLYTQERRTGRLAGIVQRAAAFRHPASYGGSPGSGGCRRAPLQPLVHPGTQPRHSRGVQWIDGLHTGIAQLSKH